MTEIRHMTLPRQAVEAIDREVEGLREFLVDFTRELVRIPTVNPYSGDESAGRETPGQVRMARELERLGAKVQTVPVPEDVFARSKVIGPTPRDYKDRYNVVVTWRLGRGGKSILLNCHMDTVGVGGYQGDPYSGEVRDGCIYGRGSTDSKGNLVVAMAAIEALRRSGLPVDADVTFESVIDEECNGSGGGTLANRLAGIKADGCICLDGTGLYSCIGSAGVATAAVDVYGKAGHAASGAVNAIDKAVIIKLALDKMVERRRGLQPPQNMNLGVFKGGTMPAVVPDHARLEYNISYSLSEAQAAKDAGLGWSAMLVRREFEAVVQAAARADAWMAEHPPKVTWIKDLYPFQTSLAEPIVKAAELAYQTVLRPEQRKQPAPMSAWFDGAHISVHAGIPTVGMGAGMMSTAHSSCEYVAIEDLVTNAKAVALAMYAFLTATV
jgi:acetylornithine deacetylase